jgi:NADPH:quinone reductase-like Zn-dependent oxidoreductase
VAIGSAVDDLAVGDRVLPLSRGNWASHRRLKRSDIIRVPAHLPLDAAAVLRINPSTAWRMLALAPADAGDWIIQNGAGSMVAHWVRRLARDQGRPVIDVLRRTGRPSDSEHVVLDGEELVRSAREILGEGRISLALDCVSGAASGRLAAVLAPGGTLVIFGHLSGEPCTIPSTLLTAGQLCVRGFSLRPAEEGDSMSNLQALFERLSAIAAEPAMAPVIAARYPLSALDEALHHARRPQPGGRVLLTLGE